MVLATLVALAAWRLRDRPGAAALTALSVGAGVWSGGYGLELSVTTLAAKLAFAKLLYLGVVVVPVAWFVFAIEYTGRGDLVNRRRIGLLAVPAVATVALVWTTEATGLVWSSVAVAPAGPGTPVAVLAVEYGPAFWIWTAYAYALLASGTVLVVRSIPAAWLFRVQTLSLLVGVAAPWVTNLAYLLRLSALDLTPVGFVVAAVFVGVAFVRYRLLDVVPAVRDVAREELVEQLPEAVVALDDRNRIVDLNPAAATVLDTSLDAAVGAELAAVAPTLAAQLRAGTPDGADRGKADEEACGGGTDEDRAAGPGVGEDFVAGDPPRRYELRVSPLRDGPRSPRGRLLTLRDVTGRRRRERELAVLNRVLRHDIRNDVSVIRASIRLLESEPTNPRYLDRLADAAADMHELVESVREVEWLLDAGESRLLDVDVVPIAAEVAGTARRSNPNAVVETDLPSVEWVRATDLLRSAIHNLVENAIEHNDAACPRVRIAVERGVDDGEFVDVVVADDGPGLPEHARRTLEGVRNGRLGDETPGEPAAGAHGLGLWLVNWIVTDCGGEVVAEPNEPRGTVVRLRLRPADGPDEPDRGWPTDESAATGADDREDAGSGGSFGGTTGAGGATTAARIGSPEGAS